MSCQECERPSNNQYFNCPPRMADGRHFTDYRPRCAQQFPRTPKDGGASAYDQRMHLMRNAEDLILQNAAMAYLQNRCGPCVEPYDEGTMLPEHEKQTCNARTCSFAISNPYGLGLGRNFGGDDAAARAAFLAEKAKETTFFQQSAPCCGTLQDDLLYYPLEGLGRSSVPGGAPL